MAEIQVEEIRHPGREMDILVATRVMGWTAAYVDRAHPFGLRLTIGAPEDLDFYDGQTGRRPCGWSPSTDIAAAWEVLDTMRFRDVSVNVSISRDGLTTEVQLDAGRAFVVESAPTAPLAICRAALAL